MAGEGQARRSDEALSAQSANVSSVTLGLIPAPEMPEEIAAELSTELPELLSQGVDGRVSWDVSVFCDPLTGSDPDAARVIEAGHERMVEESWDLAICLTDLPLRTDGPPVVAAVSAARKVAVLSLPPLGASLLRRRVEEATLQLVNELYEGSPEFGSDGEFRDSEKVGAGTTAGANAGTNAGEERRPGPRPRRLLSHRLAELVAPIQRVTPTDDDEDIDVRFVTPKARGHLRLLAGMVRANRPWRLFSTMKGTLAAAFATAAYALVMPIIWQMADSLSWVRLLALMVLSLVAMVVWIIVAHHLWERSADREARDQVALYNAATALTLTVAVLYSYAVLFVLVLVAAGIFLDSGFLQSILGHPVGLSDYVRLTWMATSLATVAGALGSGLEDEETVREATYGYRQQRRTDPDDPEGASHTQ
jgi:hypothetical protein